MFGLYRIIAMIVVSALSLAAVIPAFAEEAWSEAVESAPAEEPVQETVTLTVENAIEAPVALAVETAQAASVVTEDVEEEQDEDPEEETDDGAEEGAGNAEIAQGDGASESVPEAEEAGKIGETVEAANGENTGETVNPEDSEEPDDESEEADATFDMPEVWVDGEAALSDEIWVITAEDADAVLRFCWTDTGATAYAATVTDADGVALANLGTGATFLEIEAETCADSERCAIAVTAVYPDGVSDAAVLAFRVEITASEEEADAQPAESDEDGDADEETTEETTGTSTGSKHSSKHSSSGKSGKKSSGSSGASSSGKKHESTGSHSSGKASAQGAGEAVDRLTLLGEALDVVLDDGEGSFTVEQSDGALTLTPVGDGEAWRIGASAVDVLSDAGVEVLTLTVGEKTYALRLAAVADTTETVSTEAASDLAWRVTADGIEIIDDALVLTWSAVSSHSGR